MPDVRASLRVSVMARATTCMDAGRSAWIRCIELVSAGITLPDQGEWEEKAPLFCERGGVLGIHKLESLPFLLCRVTLPNSHQIGGHADPTRLISDSCAGERATTRTVAGDILYPMSPSSPIWYTFSTSIEPDQPSPGPLPRSAPIRASSRRSGSQMISQTLWFRRYFDLPGPAFDLVLCNAVISLRKWRPEVGGLT